MSLRIRTVLIDDEPPARERLAHLLAAHPQVEIIGQAGDLPSAAALCHRERPQLIFLDIQLPRASGFDLIPLLDCHPAVIFVTAFHDHALMAFEVNALDYLLKPVHPERLAAALARVGPARAPQNGLIALPEDRGIRMIPEKSITHIEAEDNYTLVHFLQDPPAMVRRTLSEWEKQLPAAEFLRLSRSLLVRLSAVRAIHTESREISLLHLSGCATPIRLGRRASLTLRRTLTK